MAVFRYTRKPYAEFDFSEAHKEISDITQDKLKAGDVHAFVPVEFSLYGQADGGSEVKITRYAPVKNRKEMEKYFEMLKECVGEEGAVSEKGKARFSPGVLKELQKATDTSEAVLTMLKLDSDKSLRAFIKPQENNKSLFDRILFSATGKSKKTKEEKLYLDLMSDLEEIDWQKKTEVFFEKQRRVLQKKNFNDKADDKTITDKDLPFRNLDSQAEKGKEPSAKTVTKEEVILEINGIPSFAARGDRGTIEAVKDKLKGNGIDASSFQENVVTKAVPEKSVPAKNPVQGKNAERVGKTETKTGPRAPKSRTKDLGRGGL